METWRKVWRDGFVPLLSTVGLQALRSALIHDDRRLLQGVTTSPSPISCQRDWPVDGTCAVGFCAWHGEGIDTIGEIEQHFAESCREADRRLGEPGACRYFLNWFDDAPRDQMRRALLEEVELNLADRFPIDDAEFPFSLQTKAA
jgi:hypothetical protein